MYTLLWIILGIFALLILYGHISAHIFNEKHKHYNFSSLKKDIRPYRILWFFRLLLVVSMFFFNGFIVSKLNKIVHIDNITEQKDNTGKVDKKENIKNNQSTGLNLGINTGTTNTKYGIIDEQQLQEIKDRSNIIINPIADGYYEIITSDTSSLPTFIETTRYIIPEPIDVKLCDLNYSYRNLWPEHLNYNGFIYEYINSHRENDVLIAVLDSGIDKNNKTLKGHAAKNTNEFSDGKDSDNNGYIDDIEGVNIVSGNGDIQDYNGHGSHVAGIILQTFPNASILPIKITEGSGEYIDEYAIIKGLRYAIDANVNVISMSFGGEGSNEVTNALIKEATDKGIVIIAAAGNEGKDVSGYYPANYTGVINVGSVGQKGLSSFSNINTDTLFPGECIRSYGLKESKVFWGGTSMSTPHLAGILGTYLSIGKNLGNESEILSLLNKNSKIVNKNKIVDAPKLFELEKDNNNAYKYIGSIDSTLKTIGNRLNKLKNSKFTEQDLRSVASYKSTLSTNATSLSDLYSELLINNGFGVELKKDIDNFNAILGELNQGDLYLTVNDGILSNSLGISICDPYPNCDVFDILIPGGTKLPASKSKDGYSTVRDNQTEIIIPIFQGENSIASYNFSLGTGLINIPAKPKGEVQIRVTFNVDINGKLTMTAEDQYDPSNKISETAIVKQNSTIITGDNYYKVKSIIDELIVKTNNLTGKIQNFYSLNPFDYIPQTSSGSYTITKTEFKIPEVRTKEEPNISTGTKSNILENIKVEEVIDGDTIRVTLNGQSQKIRLIGVDAPESYDTRYGYTECFGAESSKNLKILLSNKTIGLEYDSTQGRYDKYNRVLAYVFLNGENINKKIISDGYGWEYTYNLPYKYQKEFKEAQSSASKSNKGLWNKNTCNGEKKAGN